VPEVGVVAVQVRVCWNVGDTNVHVAAVTPDRSSVTVMLQVTF
jgi:hypothetical protein